MWHKSGLWMFFLWNIWIIETCEYEMIEFECWLLSYNLTSSPTVSEQMRQCQCGHCEDSRCESLRKSSSWPNVHLRKVASNRWDLSVDILAKFVFPNKVLFTQSLTFWNNLETIILSSNFEAETQLAEKQAFNILTSNFLRRRPNNQMLELTKFWLLN